MVETGTSRGRNWLEEVRIPAGDTLLRGDLVVPGSARGSVIFAHGSGSSRHSPRNRYVAEVLQQSALATLLMDLLTSDEEQLDLQTAHLRFDIDLLARRVAHAVEWLKGQPATASLGLGLFGASTGAAAALVAAAERPALVSAVVSRGGRVDLAGDALPNVRAPTLLLVGSHDEPVLELNREAMEHMRAPVDLEIIPGATHLFEEPGALAAVAERAARWFVRYL